MSQSTLSNHESTRIVIPETLHYILEKLNFDVRFGLAFSILIFDFVTWFDFNYVYQEDSTSRNARLDMLEGRQTRRLNPEKNGLTPKQFGDFLELITHQLSNYWTDDKRVQVLRLVIQIAKILGDMGEFSGLPVILYSQSWIQE